MKHTLKEFLKSYDTDFLVLRIADHTINIDAYKEGSMFIIRHFEKTNFYYVSYENKALVLDITE